MGNQFWKIQQIGKQFRSGQNGLKYKKVAIVRYFTQNIGQAYLYFLEPNRAGGF
jgi:hypothetical protein